MNERICINCQKKDDCLIRDCPHVKCDKYEQNKNINDYRICFNVHKNNYEVRAQDAPDNKEMTLYICDPPNYIKVATFESHYLAEEFMTYLSNMMNGE